MVTLTEDLKITATRTDVVKVNDRELSWVKTIYENHGNIDAIIFVRHFYNVDLRSARKMVELMKTRW